MRPRRSGAHGQTRLKTILVLGGYGGFGGRIALLLASDGFDVIVAGRDLAKAEAFRAAHPDSRMRAAAIDREAPLDAPLRELQPWLVVDAAGPFQQTDYRVPRACIAAGSHYCDLADARDFVAGIGALEAEASAADLAIIAGASSVPALSTAVVDALAVDFESLASIDIALSASNRASGSRSVTRAILSYVGRPIRLWRGQAWRTGFGWQEMSKADFAIPGRRPLRRRVALCEVPDLDLLPPRYRGRPATRFRAGTEIELQNVGLWLLSWLIRWGWLGRLDWFAPLGLWFQKKLRNVGGDRSAMAITVSGRGPSGPLARRWTLIADEGDGPWVPCFAVPLIAARLARGEIGSGARTASGLLTLDEFQPYFARHALFTATDTPVQQSLYRRTMGESFDALPDPVRGLHSVAGEQCFAGRASVDRSRHPIARLIGRLFDFPPAMVDAPVQVWIREDSGAEIWWRSFDGHGFQSRLTGRRGRLTERFGLLRFAMTLKAGSQGLSMHHVGWQLGPIPMPRFLGPQGIAVERAVDGRFHFDVPIVLPLIGLLIHYRGWLEPYAPCDPAGDG